MTVFEKIKSMNIDEFAKWYQENCIHDDDPSLDWWNYMYCSQCEPEYIYSEYFKNEDFLITNYKHGFKGIEDWNFEISRGQNLQFSAIGDSIYSDVQKKGFYRCIKPKNGDVFMSYYMRGTSEDLSILGHETGHMLSHALFKDKINPIVSGFLSETESYLFELLMNSYIANELNLPDLALHLEANRTQKTVDTIWNIRAQQILYRQFGNKPNLKRLTRILNKEGLQIDYTKANFNDITTFNLFELHHLLHSHLVALHFYKRIMEDVEKYSPCLDCSYKNRYKRFKDILKEKSEDEVKECN